MKKNRNQARDVGFYILILVILLATVFTMTSQNNVAPKVTYSKVIELFEAEQVESFGTTGNELELKLREPYEGATVITTELASVTFLRDDLGELIKQQKADGVLTEYDYNPPKAIPWWVNMLPYFGVIIIFGIFWYVMMKSASKGGGAGGGAMKFGKARVRLGSDEKKKVTFADVAGADE